MSELQLKNGLNNKHIAIAQHMVAHPEHSQRQLSNIFGVTEAWLSLVIRSNVFQVTLERERRLAQDQTLAKRAKRLEVIDEKVLNNLERGLDMQMDALNDPHTELRDINRSVEILTNKVKLKDQPSLNINAGDGATIQVLQEKIREAQIHLTKDPSQEKSALEGSAEPDVFDQVQAMFENA